MIWEEAEVGGAIQITKGSGRVVAMSSAVAHGETSL